MYGGLNSKVNWLNIIFLKDFVSYLSIEDLKEIGFTSKLVREKLKPSLFNNLKLSYNNINTKLEVSDNIFIEYCNIILNPGSASNSKKVKKLSIEAGLKDIAHVLNDIKSYTKSFHLSGVYRAGYYLFPVINIFDKLTSLKLEVCFFSLEKFSKLGDLIPSLKSIELAGVSLIKQPSDDISPKELSFPSNLSFLNISECEVIDVDLISNPYEFLFNEDFSRFEQSNFTFPEISVPSLKELVFYVNDDSDCGIIKFLELNPNLETLDINCFNSNMITRLSSLKNLELQDEIIFDGSTDNSTLESLKYLKITIDDDNTYENIKKLCLLCPNLDYLSFYIEDIKEFHHFIERYMVPILTNLLKLKTLQLEIIKSNDDSNEPNAEDEAQEARNEDEVVDFTEFSKIDTLILEMESKAIFNFNPENYKHLNYIELTSTTSNINTFKFREKFNGYKSWGFKFGERIIRGYKLTK
ncbi:hypothetical protein CONCODRAFT_80418, partial [Conidiobolus coronatus NRRL 28638]